MKFSFSVLPLLLVLAGVSAAKDFPNAPSSSMAGDADVMFIEQAPSPFVGQFREQNKIVDTKFLALGIMSAGATFADSYTTLFARQNWLAGKKGVCNMEVQSAYLYGAHPTAGRAYVVASAKSALSLISAYYLRKHHKRFWATPLLANTAIGLQGVTQNMIACN